VKGRDKKKESHRVPKRTLWSIGEKGITYEKGGEKGPALPGAGQIEERNVEEERRGSGIVAMSGPKGGKVEKCKGGERGGEFSSEGKNLAPVGKGTGRINFNKWGRKKDQPFSTVEIG